MGFQGRGPDGHRGTVPAPDGVVVAARSGANRGWTGMTARRKLAIGSVVLTGLTAYVAYLGAAASWQYYLTVDECLAGAGSLGQNRVRVSGGVAPGSLRIAPDRRQAHFSMEGTERNLHVTRKGPLPDNLAEGAEVIAEGRFDDMGTLQADKLITRCAGKYRSQRPPQASEDDAQAEDEGGG
jgi:cytochrome c-type biogenesis protein CcmE